MQFEYLCVAIMGMGKSTTARLNELGREGWELVETSTVWHYLKREIPTHAKPAGGRSVLPAGAEQGEERIQNLEERLRMLEETNGFLQRLLENRTPEARTPRSGDPTDQS